MQKKALVLMIPCLTSDGENEILRAANISNLKRKEETRNSTLLLSVFALSIKTLLKAFAVLRKEKLSWKRPFFYLKSDVLYPWKHNSLEFGSGLRIKNSASYSPVDLHLSRRVSTNERICRGNSFVSSVYNLCFLRGYSFCF